jgi:hypothetical protein
MLNAQITNTFIGQEYGWDRVSDADPVMLRQNCDSMMGVLQNPDRFPKADFAKAEQIVRAIDAFFNDHGAMLEQFA